MRQRRHAQTSPWLKSILGLSLVVIVVWAAGMVVFAARVPDQVADEKLKTDAIVVLTGGSGRLREGLNLLMANRARQMFVSGVYRGVDVKQLLALLQQRPDDVEGRISIGNAVDTIENALETRTWMSANGYTSMRLVTAAYHMPRSLLEFQNAMPDVKIVPHPVFPEHVKQEKWWMFPGTFTLMATEYNKFLVVWVRHRVKLLDLAGAPKSDEPYEQ